MTREQPPRSSSANTCFVPQLSRCFYCYDALAPLRAEHLFLATAIANGLDNFIDLRLADSVLSNANDHLTRQR